jgi:histidine phosphotransfer protein HptB
MEQAIDFDNLQRITDGDGEMEAELFKIFIDSSAVCMQELRTAHAAQDAEAWSTQAHAFKGISVNLGAKPLGQLCSEAQRNCRAPAEDKAKMLAAIEKELERVKDALKDYNAKRS